MAQNKKIDALGGTTVAIWAAMGLAAPEVPFSAAVQALKTVSPKRSQITENFLGVQSPNFAKRMPELTVDQAG